MGSDSTGFEALVLAAVGATLGVAYLIGAALTIMDASVSNMLLLSGSWPVTAVIGTMLVLAAGLLATRQWSARLVGVMAFGAVAVFGRPSLADPSSIAVAQTTVGVALALYMGIKNPVTRGDRSNVDESTSASRYGSTIR